MKIKCAGCTIEFEPERSNKFYHNSKCQKKFNNEKQKAIRHEKAVAQKPLDQNFKVLKKILGSAETVTKSLDFLEGAGVDLRFYTSKGLTPDKKTAFVFYTIGLVQNNETKFQIYKITCK